MISSTVTKDRFSILSTVPVASYSITFKFWGTSQLKVLVADSTGAVRTIAASQYTVTMTDTAASLSFVPGFVFEMADEVLTILRQLELTQSLDYQNGDYFDADNLELSLDYLTSLAQQLSELMSRSVVAPATDSAAQTDLELPAAAARKNMLLGFNADGNMIPVLTTDIEQKLQQALDAELSTIALEAQTQILHDETSRFREGIETYATYAEYAAQRAADDSLHAQQSAAEAQARKDEAGQSAASASGSKAAAASSEASALAFKQSASIDAAKTAEDRTAVSNDKAVAINARDASIATRNQAEAIRNATDQIRLTVVNLMAQIQQAASVAIAPIVVIDGVSYYKSEFSEDGRMYTDLTLVV